MKTILAIFALVCFTTIGFSQSTKDVKYGIRAGYNISNLDFDPEAPIENRHRNGFAFGFFAEVPLSEVTSINTELQWSAEGGKSRDIRANYFNLPIQLRFALSENLSIGAGPQVSLKTWEDNDSFSTFAFSGVAGVEYVFTNDLFIDLRYSYGLTNILDDEASPLEATNFNFQIGIGIKI
ncbi:porin family protein [Winogradskyella immobilis]|uniref:PorT family protein n=1 Tax=Winogradskyella immobilis TaxID=2816852 RepID=A0ABS8EQV0_9FLAO|nr:porin family protein [Winogradskyella immobilis]MCC1485609.1 PorT family protein [Winogradskyella immobilis]MCG0017701.1 PorT family protein [Winogradskyella immobilis]